MTTLIEGNGDIVPAVSTAVSSMLKEGGTKLQSAIDLVKSLKLYNDEKKPGEMIAVIEEVKDVDPDQVFFIARTLAEQVTFDSIVMKKIGGIAVGDDYKEINEAFASLRKDLKEAAENAADGEEGIFDKLVGFFKEMTKGGVDDRWARIEQTFERVTSTLAAQLKAEKEIMLAYQMFRGALGQSQVAALNVKAALQAQLDAAKAKSKAAQDALDAAQSADDATKVSLQIARDEANNGVAKAESRYDVGKDLAEHLMIAYNVSEVTMKKYEGLTNLKDRVHKRMVSIYSTNRVTLASFKAVYSAAVGLAEGTKTLDAMTGGMNDTLNDLADLTGDINKKAIKSGYGATVSPEAMRNFTQAMLKEFDEFDSLVAESRAEATRSAEEIRADGEDLQRRYTAMVTKTAA